MEGNRIVLYSFSGESPDSDKLGFGFQRRIILGEMNRLSATQSPLPENISIRVLTERDPLKVFLSNFQLLNRPRVYLNFPLSPTH